MSESVVIEPPELSRAASFHRSRTPEARLQWIRRHLGQEAYEKASELLRKRRDGVDPQEGERQ